MIPTMILFGLVFGRWWKLALIVGTVFWPLLLMWDGVYEQTSDPNVTTTGGWLGLTMGAAFLGFLNTGIGVALHQSVLALLRRGSGLADRLSATGSGNIPD